MEPVIAEILSDRIKPCPRCRQRVIACEVNPDKGNNCIICKGCGYKGPSRKIINDAIVAWNEVN